MREVTNHEYGQKCEWCYGKIDVGETCIQSESVFCRKWHLECTPEMRNARFRQGMNRDYTKEILRQENECITTCNEKRSGKS